MFALQRSKRGRDDDSDSDDDRFLKKTRVWSLPSFPTQSQTRSFSHPPIRPTFPPSPPQTLPAWAPAAPSRPDHGAPSSPPHMHDDACPFSLADADMDTDMDDDDLDVVGSQPPDSPFIMRPPKLDPTLFGRDTAATNTGRMPTPIYPSFHAPRNSASGMGGVGYPSSGFAGSMGLATTCLGVPTNPILRTPPAPVEPQRAHRIPSPISEDEDIPDTPTAFAQSQLSRLSVTSNMDLGSISEDADMPPPPGVDTTPARGRKRSGALSAKGRFSMGYRDDCDKCRMRVPGHYSHFL